MEISISKTAGAFWSFAKPLLKMLGWMTLLYLAWSFLLAYWKLIAGISAVLIVLAVYFRKSIFTSFGKDTKLEKDPAENSTPAPEAKETDKKDDKKDAKKTTKSRFSFYTFFEWVGAFVLVFFVWQILSTRKDREAEKNRAVNTHTTAPSESTGDPFWDATPKADLNGSPMITLTMTKDAKYGYTKDMITRWYIPQTSDTVIFTIRYYPGGEVYSKWQALFINDTLKYHVLETVPKTSLTGKYTVESDRHATVRIGNTASMKPYTVIEF